MTLHNNLIGKTFGRLFVVEYVGNNKWGNPKYLCVCNCENKKEVVVLSGHLVSGVTKSCGCLAREVSSIVHSKKDEIIGKTFGKLIVLSLHGKSKSGNNVYLCQCSCSNKKDVFVDGSSLLLKRIISCGCSSESSIASELKTYCHKKYSAIQEYSEFVNPETDCSLPFDIYIPKYSIFCEVQGIQHYKFVKHWHKTKENFEYQQWRDSIKKEYAEQNGYYLEIDLRKIKTIEQAIDYLESYLDNFRQEI